MTSPAPSWQLDRLSTSAREAAEIASLGAGLSLSSWLSRLISETCAAEGVAPPSEPPKILEFTREPRERPVMAPPRVFAPAPAPVVQAPVAPAPGAEPPRVVMPNFAAEPPHIMPAPMPQPAPMPVAPPAAPVMRPAAEQQPVFNPAPSPLFAPAAPPVMMPLRPAAANAPMPTPAPVAAAPAPQAPVVPGATMLATSSMAPANLGTRRGEDLPEALLSDIATRGVRQPIVVRRVANNPERYEIICGHRRWRAAQRVGLSSLPATVVTQDDATAILTSLAENLQSGSLAAMDEAQAYLRLLTQCAVDASAVTAATGSDRKHIVQTMRLLGLPPLVRHLVGAGTLSREHAYLLLDAPNPETLADAILAEGLSVEAVKQRLTGGTK